MERILFKSCNKLLLNSILISFFSITNSFPILGQSINWMKTHSSATIRAIEAMNGSTYVVGFASGSATFDSVTIPNNPGNAQSYFLLKINREGEIIWSKSLKTRPNDLTIDNGENIIIVGGFPQRLLTKFTKDGELVFEKLLPYGLNTSVVTDSQNNIIICGDDWSDDSGEIVIESQLFTGLSFGTHGYLIKYDKDGNFVWFTHTNGEVAIKDYTIFRDVAVDSNDNVIVAGDIKIENDISIDLGGETIESTNEQDGVVIKYNSDGILQWSNLISGSSEVFANKLAITGNNEIAIVGTFTGEMSIDEFSLETINKTLNYEIFLSKLSPDGNTVWAKSMGGWYGDVSYLEAGRTVIVDTEDNFYVGGVFAQKAYFDDDKTYSIDADSNGFGTSGFFAKYNSFGKFQWAYNLKGSESDIYEMALDEKNIILSGVYRAPATFIEEPIIPTNSSVPNLFIISNNLQTTITEIEDNRISVNGLFELYPNPASEELVIRMKSESLFWNVTIQDLNGRSLISKESKIDTCLIGIGSLPPGLYIVKVQTANSTDITKLVVH